MLGESVVCPGGAAVAIHAIPYSISVRKFNRASKNLILKGMSGDQSAKDFGAIGMSSTNEKIYYFFSGK